MFTTAVFVRRCADYILRNEPTRYAFFIYADDDYRREVVAKVYKGSSLQDVRDVDKQRKRRVLSQSASIEALRAVKHVFCEKPIDHDVAKINGDLHADRHNLTADVAFALIVGETRRSKAGYEIWRLT